MVGESALTDVITSADRPTSAADRPTSAADLYTRKLRTCKLTIKGALTFILSIVISNGDMLSVRRHFDDNCV